MRKVLALAAGLLVLAAVNWSIYSRERLLRTGTVVLLELAPVDPRSLMQGDYMALRFKVATDAFARERVPTQSEDGRIVVQLDHQGIGRYVRRDDGRQMSAGEIALRYRIRKGEPKFATNAFFFEEGTADVYARARYGEFRVGASGEMLLAHLRGENLERLGQTAANRP